MRCAWLASLFLCLSLSVWASPPAPSLGNPTELPALSLQSMIKYSENLEERLILREAQAKAQVIYWQNTVDALTKENARDKQKSKESSELLEAARLELSKSLTAYAEIFRWHEALEKTFKDYREASEAEKAASEREKKRLKWIAALGIGTGAALGVWGLTR